MHTTLIEKGIIEDPFYGHNDQTCRWVEEKVWWYRTTFHWDGQREDMERMELVFEGLDTFATVYLNGVELGSTDNMFISHSFEVTRELNKGKNVLAVKLDPVHLHVKSKMQYYWSGFSKKGYGRARTKATTAGTGGRGLSVRESGRMSIW